MDTRTLTLAALCLALALQGCPDEEETDDDAADDDAADDDDDSQVADDDSGGGDDDSVVGDDDDSAGPMGPATFLSAARIHRDRAPRPRRTAWNAPMHRAARDRSATWEPSTSPARPADCSRASEVGSSYREPI